MTLITFIFSSTLRQKAQIWRILGSFVNTFYFCTYNDGYSEDDLVAYQEDLNAIEGFSDYWWYVTLEPMFEPDDPKPDFVWLDLWGLMRTKLLTKQYLAIQTYQPR